jgi:UDP-glucuronate decarboxylase
VGETLCFEFNRQYGTRVRVIRIFNTYGPRMDPDDGRVVSSFIRDGIKGKPFQVFGDGKQTRSFCFVSDLVAGLRAAMDSGITGPVNLGNPNEFTMLELAERILHLVGGQSKITFHPLPTDDPRQRQPDITLAKKELNWQPKITLEDGLIETIAYFRRLFS